MSELLNCRLPLQRFPGEEAFYYVEISEHYRTMLGIDRPVRVVGTLQGEPFRLKLMKWDDIWYIWVGKELRRKHNLGQGDLVDIQLTIDPSPDQVDQPIELALLLADETQAQATLLALTPGAQRSIAHYVGKPKREETRIQKALEVLNRLLGGTIADWLRAKRGG